jgi:hypothetical protein
MWSIRETSTSRGSTARKPWTVFRSTGQMAPKAITVMIIWLVSPRRRMAAGRIAEAGSGRMNSRVGSKKSLAVRDKPMAAPRSMPRSEAANHPTSIRQQVSSSADQRTPVRIWSNSARSVLPGLGK